MTKEEALDQARLLLQNLVHYPNLFGRRLQWLEEDINRLAQAIMTTYERGRKDGAQ